MKSKKINVLMISRSTLYSSPGGDTIQIENTAKYLRKYSDINVDIKLSDENIDYKSYDLMHFFNIIRPNDFLHHVKRSNLPFVISTIFVDYSEYEKKARQGIVKYLNLITSSDTLEYIKVIARVLKSQEKLLDLSYLWRGQKNSIKYLIKNSSQLLPNSQSEYNRVEKHFNISQKYSVIPNAIDTSVFDESSININKKFKDSIICVGRIEGRKNQLNLIKAVNKTNFKLFIIGKKSPNQLSYYDTCKKEAYENNNIKFIDHVSQNELAKIMRASKVHALISWFETTGLVSLEAAYLGCNLVITNRGDQLEYFKNSATYCEPDNIDSIVSALIIAHKKDFDIKFKEKIKNEYTWEKTASETYKAYKEIINKESQK
jgi:glycosyltransferase involved in cell wall biosynthesis